jgi:hypothetical protein
MMAEKNSPICAEKKKIYRVPILGCFRPSDHSACPILAVSAHWTTVDHEHGPLWIMNMDHCVLENRKNNFLEPFLGPKILLQGQKGNFG